MFNSKKRAIGIFGGSFDPPHKGHIAISKISLKKLNLEKIFWIITKKNPFKKESYFSLSQRISRSKKLTKKYSKMKILYLENKVQSNRTIHVLKYFKRKKKQFDLYLIVGSDNLQYFHKWTSWKKIVKLSKLVVFSRKGYDKKGRNSAVAKYLKKKNVIFIKNKLFNISSSKIKKENFKI